MENQEKKFDSQKFDEIIASTIPEIIGMDDWTEQEKAEYLLKVSKVLENRVLDALLTELGDDRKIQFEKLMNENPDAAYNYLTEQIPNIDEITHLEVAKYKMELDSKLNS